MKRGNSLLDIVLIALLVMFISSFLIGGRKLNKAARMIDKVNNELVEVKDSLQSAQKSIEGLLKKLEIAENELNILRTERELIELEEKRQNAKNWKELQYLKEEIKIKQETKQILIEKAKEFEL